MEPFRIEDDMLLLLDSLDNDDLDSFAESQDDPSSNEQIELHIYTCFLIFKRLKSIKHLEAATQRAEGWLAVTPPDHPDRARRATIFALSWNSRRMLLGETDIRVNNLCSQAVAIAVRCRETRNLVDLNKAISIMERVGTLAGDRIQPDMLQNHGAMIGLRFTMTRSVGDLDQAVDLTTKAIEGMPQGYANLDASRSLQTWLNTRFEQTESMDDLNRLIEVGYAIVEAAPRDHPFRAATMSNLQTWHNKRFEKTGDLSELDRVIGLATTSLRDGPLSSAPYRGNHLMSDVPYPDRDGILENLQIALMERFRMTGSEEDLDRTIETLGKMVGDGACSSPDHARRLCKFGVCLFDRFQRTNSLEDLNRAIDAGTRAINTTTPEDNPHHVGIVTNVVDWLHARFRQTRSMEDLNRSIDIAGTAATMECQTDAQGQACLLAVFANGLSLRFERTGAIDDINHAIDVGTAMVDILPQDREKPPVLMQMFGNLFSRRFERLGSMEDLDRAIEIATKTIDASSCLTLGTIFACGSSRSGLSRT